MRLQDVSVQDNWSQKLAQVEKPIFARHSWS